jgi:hypothetical protein
VLATTTPLSLAATTPKTVIVVMAKFSRHDASAVLAITTMLSAAGMLYLGVPAAYGDVDIENYSLPSHAGTLLSTITHGQQPSTDV